MTVIAPHHRNAWTANQDRRRDGSATAYPFVLVDEATKLAVRAKGTATPGRDPAKYRKDMFGSWMEYGQHGQEGGFGWEIDHIRPTTKDAPDLELA